ncbi:molybdopterin-binding protein [Piscinibacter koreensis]|uniref:Molybdopterin-dependent oxidoreductase n=1 Tax=Piscinibacter koreensis TaxID=2742824 RepID=A0A7Y6NLJ7_9BURK|nr:molybdopterin-binding protein [Schlegelella koreensis]NUZ05324.1 molybdopterin-dependent oxidoreductase [Schlegelella koreensis]
MTENGHAASRRGVLRGALAAAGSALLTGCDRLSQTPAVVGVLSSVQHLSRAVHRGLVGPHAMAQEFGPEDIAPQFRSNGTLMPRDADYQAHLAAAFADYRLSIGGLVERPQAFTLAELRALPSRTQITRHDCVEGWSCIGKWTGVPLAHLLGMARPLPAARYVLFRCYDSMDAPAPGRDSRYYESIDLDEARHPQTLVAYDLNDRALPVSNGAPLRLRVERQLGYKHAKYLQSIELVERFDQLRGGKGGYWEDQGYEWYAGI